MFEKFKEFRKDFSERIRSPFVSALIISWSVYNWKIYYLMFYNAEVISLEKRISNIQDYLSCRSQWEMIWGPVSAAFIGLILLNISKSIGLGISLLYENWASPWMQKKLYNDKIIEKYKYERIRKQYNQLRDEYSEKEGLYVQNEKDIREIESNFKQYRYNSIPTRYENINQLFDPDYEWVNNFTNLKTKENGSKMFSVDFNGINEEGNNHYNIEEIKVSDDGFVVLFNKTLPDGHKLLNILIRDKEGNFTGVEDGFVKIEYIKGNKTDVVKTKKIPVSK